LGDYGRAEEALLHFCRQEYRKTTRVNSIPSAESLSASSEAMDKWIVTTSVRNAFACVACLYFLCDGFLIIDTYWFAVNFICFFSISLVPFQMVPLVCTCWVIFAAHRTGKTEPNSITECHSR
jgi:hypothetical protein